MSGSAENDVDLGAVADDCTQQNQVLYGISDVKPFS